MGQPHELRRGNRRKVVQLLLEQRTPRDDILTRPQLAELTGLSKVTVNAIVQELQEAGILELARTQTDHTSLGRVPQSIRLNCKCGTVVSGDVQPGQLVLREQALTTNDQHELRVTFEPAQTTSAILKQLRQLACTKRFGPLKQILLAVPAPVCPDGKIGEPNSVPELVSGEVEAWAHSAGIAVALENDANLAAFAAGDLLPDQTHLAALIERRSGTGLGLLLDGSVYRGMNGRAGELGRSAWPTTDGTGVLEQLPDAERLRATTFLLASLALTLDLQHVVLGLPERRARTLQMSLKPLLPQGVSLSVVQNVDHLILNGASLRAAELARTTFLDDINTLVGGGIYVA